jgi:hypothetical protein
LDIEQQIVNMAKQDMRHWMSNVGRETTEGMVLAWQQGYILGVQRALSIEQDSEVEEM